MHRVPFGERDIFGIVRPAALAKAGDPGIVDENIEPPMHREHRSKRRFPLRLVADIQRVEMVLGSERFGKRLPIDGIDIGHPHGRTFVGERFGNARANAACGSGDERDLVGHAVHARPTRPIGAARRTAIAR